MKYLYNFSLCAALLGFVTSCADVEQLDYNVAKPESIAMQEEINAYDPLKTYAEEGLMLGAGGVSLATYTSQGVPYRLINSNFNQVTLASGMNHADVVQSSGTLETGNVEDVLELANDAGLAVFGHALAWHLNQNSEYLNSTIAPIVIPAQGGPQWLEVTSNDFETDDVANIVTNDGAELSYTADGEGANGEGRALKITNSAVRENDWESQLFLTWDTPTEVGERYRLTMDIRADEAATIPTQAQVVAFQYKHWNFFGQFTPTTEWSNVVVEITIDENTSGCAALAFNLGTIATSYYFDNIVLERFNEDGGGPTWDLLSGNDFETEDASNYQGNNNAGISFTADGEGANGDGRALAVTNSAVRDNDWESQLFFTFQPASEVGQQLQLTMDIKADQAASFATQAQVVPFQYKHWNFFGSFTATTEWQSVSVQITVDENTTGCTAIAFNLGNTATTYYFDNIEVRWFNEEGAGETIIEKTPEEKRDTLSYEMEKWISGMVTASRDYVSAWNVLNEPMDDENPAELRSGEGIEPGDNEFYWQDYLGKDYGVLAFSLAREYAKDGDLLFINESNLESNPEKVQGLIDYVEYIESEGPSVDGIGTQMHLTVDSDKDQIVQMFQLLAATGKMIRISELNVSIGVEPTEELMQEQADMYQHVVDAYKEHIPKEQRYGITIWGVSDVAGDTPTYQGLWNAQYTRKPAYVGFADGLGTN